MFTKKLITAGLPVIFCALSHAIPKENDSTFILIKVINNNFGQNPIVSFSEPGVYFTKFSYSSNAVKYPSNGPLYRIRSGAPLKFSIIGGIPGMVEGMALPGDTTVIEIDISKQGAPIKFSGKAAPICEFYNASGKTLREFYPRAYSQNTIDSYVGYFNFLEEHYQRKDSFYNAYVKYNPLPDWFRDYYKTTLVYEKVLAMIENIHTINYGSKNKVYPNPEFLLWFRDIDVDNPQAIGNPVYFDFLWQYFLWKSKIVWNRTRGGKISTSWFAFALPNINSELKDPVREWFLKELLVNYYAAMEVDEVDSVFLLAKPFLKNNIYLDEIKNYRNTAIESREKRFSKAAKAGSKAPNFHLADSLDMLYSIDKFYGKWTYLRFYNTKSFSEENFKTRLLDDSVFRQKGQVVNIYTNSEKKEWIKVLAKYPRSGFHLFCKGNWGDMLRYQYGLRSFPYAVLVDPQGVIKYSGTPADNDVIDIIKL